MANEPSGGISAARSFGLNVGGAALGGALARMLGNPAIATAVQTSVEERKAQIQDEWHRDIDQKFVKMYGQQAQQQQAEIEANYVAATKLVPIPMEARPDSADAMAQAADPKAPPTTPMLGYRIVDPQTGEASYIPADTQEAVEHFRQTTQEYYGGLQSVLTGFLDATAQYPDNPYIARRAETVINSVTGAIAAKREAAEAAQQQQGMAAQRLGMEVSQEQLLEARDQRGERAIMREAEAQEGADIAEENNMPIPQTKEQARILAKRKEIQTKREAEEQQTARFQREQDAYVLVGADAVADEGGDPNSMSPRELAARGKFEEFQTELLTKADGLLAKGQPLQPHVDQRGLLHLATLGKSGFEKIENAARLQKADYESFIARARDLKLKALTDVSSLMKGEGSPAWMQADAEVRAEHPPMPPHELEKQVVKRTIYQWVVDSPEWQKKNVFGQGHKSVEEALGVWYPDLYPDWVKDDPTKPLSPDNNMTSPKPDPYEPPKEPTVEEMTLAEQSELMPEERPSYKRAASVVENLERSRYTGIPRPSNDEIKQALEAVRLEIQLMHYGETKMAQAQVQSPIEMRHYIAQMQEHARSYQPVFEMLKQLLLSLPEKERKAWLAQGKKQGLLDRKPQASQTKPKSKGLLETHEDLLNFAKE